MSTFGYEPTHFSFLFLPLTICATFVCEQQAEWVSSTGGVQVYILGFTAGGFLNIALVTVLPDLLQEDRPAQSCAQLLCLLFGTLTMATVALTC